MEIIFGIIGCIVQRHSPFAEQHQHFPLALGPGQLCCFAQGEPAFTIEIYCLRAHFILLSCNPVAFFLDIPLKLIEIHFPGLFYNAFKYWFLGPSSSEVSKSLMASL